MKPTIKTIALYLLLIISVGFAVIPLFQRRYIPTHDGEYHIIRIVEFSKMISSGIYFPRWAPTLNSGYGVPVFQFNYPFPNYIGYAVRLFTHDAVYAFQYSMGLGYIVLAIGMYLWLSSIFNRYSAIIGTIVGIFVPYLFLDMYIRGSIGEIWATGFLYVTLFFLEKKRFIFISISFACLILSHNIMAMIYTPFILLYCVITDIQLLLPIFAGTGMSAFFWMPALLEAKFVQGLNTVNFKEHFVQLYEFLIPSWGSQFSGTGSVGNKISFQIGLAPIISMVTAIFRVRNVKENRRKHLYFMIMSAFLVSVLFMSSISVLLWEYIPLLQNVQYPWRLLAFVVPAASFSAAVWVSSLKNKWVGIILAAFAVGVASSYARPVTYEPRNEGYYMARPNFTDGTSSMGNSFSTIWTGWKQIRANTIVDLSEGMTLISHSDAFLDKKFTLSTKSSGDVVFHVLYFPGWTLYIDNKIASIQYQQDGIIHATIPAGIHSIRLQFKNSPIRAAADILSILSLVGILSWGILHTYEHRN